MDPTPRLTLRLSRDLWRVVAALRLRWGLTNEGVVRKLLADAGGLPGPDAQRHDELAGQGAPRDDSRP